MTRRWSPLLPLAALLATTTLAGCMGGNDAPPDEPELPADYAAAKAAPGAVYEPKHTDSPVRLKLLHPADPTHAEEGDTWVVVLLFDSNLDEPITDADFELRARMEAMGHGTAGERDPVHRHDGMYIGMTDFIMGGEWTVNLDPRLADGTDLEFDITILVGGEGGTDEMEETQGQRT